MTCVASWRVRHQDGAVGSGGPRKTQRPVAGAIEDVPGAADQPDPGDERPIGAEPVQHELLTGNLCLAVGRHALHDVLVERRQYRRRLILARAAVVGVHVARGDEDVELAAPGQRRYCRPDLARLAGDIDDHVPRFARD